MSNQFYDEESEAERESRLLLEELGIPVPQHLQRFSRPQTSTETPPLQPQVAPRPPALVSSTPANPDRRPSSHPTPPPLSERRRRRSPSLEETERKPSRRRFDEPTPEEEEFHREVLRRQAGPSTSKKPSEEEPLSREERIKIYEAERRKSTLKREAEFLRRRPASFASSQSRIESQPRVEDPPKPAALELPIQHHRHHLVTPVDGRDTLVDLCNLVMNGLPFEAEDRDLMEYFRAYGRVTSVRVMLDGHTRESRGFGFVNFEHPADAQAALDDANRGRKLMGRHLSVKFHRPSVNSIVSKAVLSSRAQAPPQPPLREQPLLTSTSRARSRSRSPSRSRPSRTPPPPWSPPRKTATLSNAANGSWRQHRLQVEMQKDRAPPPPPKESRGKSLPAVLGLPWLEQVDAELLGVLAGFLEGMEKLERDALVAQLTDYTSEERATFIALLPQLRQQEQHKEAEEAASAGPVVHPSRRDAASSSAAKEASSAPPPPPPPKLGSGMRSDWS